MVAVIFWNAGLNKPVQRLRVIGLEASQEAIVGFWGVLKIKAIHDDQSRDSFGGFERGAEGDGGSGGLGGENSAFYLVGVENNEDVIHQPVE